LRDVWHGQRIFWSHERRFRKSGEQELNVTPPFVQSPEPRPASTDAPTEDKKKWAASVRKRPDVFQ